MDYLPKRTNLVTETLLTLKEWIASSVLSGTLPGEHRLKERLRVSRGTLRLALKTLESEGWITRASKGLQRRVQPGPDHERRASPARDLPVCFLSPRSIVDRKTLLELEELQKRLAEQRRELRFLATNESRFKNPEPYLRRLVDENPAAAWILNLVSERTQRWFEQRGLPAFIYGPPFPGVKLRYIAYDWESAAFHAGGLLMRHGHRVIGLLEDERPMPSEMAIERGLRRALSTQPGEGRLQVFKDQRTPETVARSLELALKPRARPTALVFTRSNQLLACFSWMLWRKIGVPRDVSLISIAENFWFQDLHPPVCHYKNNSKACAQHLAQRVMELVETGQITHKSLRMPLEYVPGSTVGPVPGTA